MSDDELLPSLSPGWDSSLKSHNYAGGNTIIAGLPIGSRLRTYGAGVGLVFLVLSLVSGCGDSSLMAPKPLPRPNLVVESVESPGVNQGTVGPGAPFTLSATVRNDGNGDAHASTLRYYLSSDAAITTDDTEVGAAVAVAELAAAASVGASVDLTAPADPGTYYYGACVDPVTDESDTNNNCSTSVQVTVADAPPPPQGAPDLVVAAPSVTNSRPTAGASFTLSATVRNDGNGDAHASTLRYYLSSDAAITTDDTEVGAAVAVAELAAAASVGASVDLTAPADPGTYYYGACVDPVTDESDTNNNCSTSVQVEVVSPLSFQGTVADQTYPTGQAITPLVLPAAAGGRGSLIYSLRPEIPGLSFDSGRRTLSGTPTEAGSHRMSYTVTDGKDSASSNFIITIEPAAGLSSRYRGSGDQVFVLNPDGAMLDAEPYTLILGNASAEVYLIATNTATYPMDPHIERLDLIRGRRAAVQDSYMPSPRPAAHSARVPERAGITEFNNNPPLSTRSAPAEGARLQTQSQQGVAEGDRFTFRDLDAGNLVFIPATARRVVTDGDTTLALWVADRDWGPNCRGGWPCLTGEMVNALADRFLRPGSGNDIHDWVTAVYGDPWGSHDLPLLIPPDADDEIHILLFDIRDDGIPAPGECRIVGFFWAVHNYRQGNPRIPPVSAERLIFFMDSVYMAIPEGPSWEVTDRGPSIVISTLAHEYQHMIHFYQKPVLRNTISETWLNEMASEVAEDLIADKLMVNGPRGVAYDNPAAGQPGNERGRLPYYNLFNDLQVTVWNNVIANYSLNYALGAYLARTYGGAALFSDIVQSADSGIAAIEAALADAGHDVSFGQVLADWAVATLLSDDTAAPAPYRYNPGAWSTSYTDGEQFRLGSINLFNYRYEPPEIVSDCIGPDLASRSALDGPYLHSLRTFNARSQPPHSNMFATLGRNSGSVRLSVSATAGNLITVVVKE